jgi:hypothetical protein
MMGLVRLMMNEMLSRRRMRVMTARPIPRVRAFACCFAGSLDERMAMKITLSMPRTISSAISVNSATMLSI